MKKICECDQCGKIFGTDNESACRLRVWKFCSLECLSMWAIEGAEGLDDDDFMENEDDGE